MRQERSLYWHFRSITSVASVTKNLLLTVVTRFTVWMQSWQTLRLVMNIALVPAVEAPPRCSMESLPVRKRFGKHAQMYLEWTPNLNLMHTQDGHQTQAHCGANPWQRNQAKVDIAAGRRVTGRPVTDFPVFTLPSRKTVSTFAETPLPSFPASKLYLAGPAKRPRSFHVKKEGGLNGIQQWLLMSLNSIWRI